MSENWKELKVSEGEEILSLNEFVKKGRDSSLKEDLSKKNLDKDTTLNEESRVKIEKKEVEAPDPSNYFNDMEEIASSEIVNIYNQEQKSKIQSIEFTNTESFFPKLFDTVSENINKKLVNNKNGTVSILQEELEEVTEKIEQNESEKTKHIKPVIKKYKITEFKSKDVQEIPTEENLEFLEKKEDISEAEVVEELEEVEELTDLTEDIDDTEYLVSLIKDGDIKYPGKVDLTSIDKNLSNTAIPEYKEEISSSNVIEGEMFGVKRAEVFYHIDKEIYAKRAAKRLDISKIKNLKSGIFLPLLVGIISFTLLLVG